MLSASTLHDALRSEGLVPPEEDVHLLACSNKWRHALERAYDSLGVDEDEDEDEDLQHEIDSLEEDFEEAQSDAVEARGQLEKAKEELAQAEGERDRALAHAIELEAELAKIRAAE
jgi:chromosome segregation ATPase